MSPDRLWGVVGDPARLATWCAEAAGLAVVGIGPGRRLVAERETRLGTVRCEWTVQPAGETGTELLQRVTATGPTERLAARGVATRLDRAWRPTCLALIGIVSAARLPRDDEPRPEPLKVVVAGGSGSLGQALATDLVCRGHDVVVLTRRVDPDVPFRQVAWDGAHVEAWAQELAGGAHTAVVNLAGRLVDVRPTPGNIASLRSSRVLPTRALVQASLQQDEPVARWVQGSTTAIWSDSGDLEVTEQTPLPTGAAALPQMTGVARPWEEAAEGANTRRLVTLRTSIVLQEGSPALDRLLWLTNLGLGGRVGSGRQWFSWIHEADWLAVVRVCLGLDPDVQIDTGIGTESGTQTNSQIDTTVVVAAAPDPVRNAALMAILRRHRRRPPAPPTPAALVRLGGVMLRTDPALGLTGRRCTSAVLADAGFRFRFEYLDEALDDLLT